MPDKPMPNKPMLDKHGILSLLLAILLIGSNMAYSGHISAHNTADPGLCSLCIHPGGTDSAIVAEAGGIFPAPRSFTPKQGSIVAHLLTVIPHDHQSRAPPYPI